MPTVMHESFLMINDDKYSLQYKQNSSVMNGTMVTYVHVCAV